MLAVLGIDSTFNRVIRTHGCVTSYELLWHTDATVARALASIRYVLRSVAAQQAARSSTLKKADVPRKFGAPATSSSSSGGLPSKGQSGPLTKDKLRDVRVVQRNLVYIIGIPPSMAKVSGYDGAEASSTSQKLGPDWPGGSEQVPTSSMCSSMSLHSPSVSRITTARHFAGAYFTQA